MGSKPGFWLVNDQCLWSLLPALRKDAAKRDLSKPSFLKPRVPRMTPDRMARPRPRNYPLDLFLGVQFGLTLLHLKREKYPWRGRVRPLGKFAVRAVNRSRADALLKVMQHQRGREGNSCHERLGAPATVGQYGPSLSRDRYPY